MSFIDRKFKIDYLVVMSASLLSAAVSFVNLKLIQIYVGDEAFNEFLLILRFASFLSSFMLLGQGVSLARYISMNRQSHMPLENDMRTLVGSFMAISLSSMVFYFVAVLFIPENETAFTTVVYSLSLVIFSISYSLYRGNSVFASGEKWRIVLLILPLPLIIVLSRDLMVFIYVYLLLNLLYLAIAAFKFMRFSGCVKDWDTRPIAFGFRRLPADLLYPLISVLPVFFAMHFSGEEYAAQLSFKISIMNMVLLFVGPISTIILPAAKKITENKTSFGTYKKLILLQSFVLMLGLSVAIKPVLSFYGFDITLFEFVFLISSVFLLSEYISSRSLFDATLEKSVVSTLSFFAVLVQVPFYLMALHGIEIEFIAAYFSSTLALYVGCKYYSRQLVAMAQN